MKSRVLRAKDYREVDVKPLLKPFVPDGAALEAELRRLTNPYIRWEDGTTVSPGDQVVCRLASDCPRFQREKVRFVAGSGMFHKELEDMSIGMEVGETREAILPEGPDMLLLPKAGTAAEVQAADAAMTQAEERLGLYLSENRGPGEEAWTVETPGFTKLAQVLGVGRASLYRAVDALCERGGLEREGKKIRVLKPNGLG